MSTPTVPVCPVAYGLPTLKLRLRHYKRCSDERCVARREAAAVMSRKLANANRRARDQVRRDCGLVRNRDGSWE